MSRGSFTLTTECLFCDNDKSVSVSRADSMKAATKALEETLNKAGWLSMSLGKTHVGYCCASCKGDFIPIQESSDDFEANDDAEVLIIADPV